MSATLAPRLTPRAGAVSRSRLVVVDLLVAFTTVLLVVGIFSVWANRLLLNPQNWSTTSTRLLQNPTVRATTANYIVDQLYLNAGVPGLIKSGLPSALQGLVAPAAGELRKLAVRGVDLALDQPRVQRLWADANYQADSVFVDIVTGGTAAASVNQGVVTLDLTPIIDSAASRLGLPSDLGSKLPPSVGHLTVLRSDQLKLVQNGGRAIRGLALWLTILVPLLYALAILLASGRRRRTLIMIGFAVALGGGIALLGRSLLVSQAPASLTTVSTLRPAIAEIVSIGTGTLGQVARACIFAGLALAVVAWVAGPVRGFFAGHRMTRSSAW